MKSVGEELEAIAAEYYPLLLALSEEEFASKPSPEKWSKKEIIGHLIDSAHNNIRRFVVSQYEVQPTILYDQDKWVRLNNYQQSKTSDIVTLWYLLNKQAATILVNTPRQVAQRCVYSSGLYTIEWLAHDYIKHLKHHVHQVLNLEPFPYP